VSTLRARQKEDRRNRIVGAAKTLFRQRGYEQTTIESIAESAGVSGVTVHNYYGTKAGVLLALVVESDEKLIARLEEELPRDPDDLVALTRAFTRMVLDHALSNLEKDIWRQVIAAVTTAPGTQLSRAYARLDQKLAHVLVRRIERMQGRGRLPAAINAMHLGQALFTLVNARFVQFISDDACTQQEIEAHLENDLVALFAVNAD
jgi:AcrR family transcriptional regulator